MEQNDSSIRILNSRKPHGFTVLYLIVFLQGVGYSVIFATLPPTARELGISVTQMGWVFMTTALLAFVTGPFWGRLSDTWGRHSIMLIGVSGFGLSMLILALVVDARSNASISAMALLTGLIISRATFGLVGGAPNAAAQGFIADRTEPDERTRSITSLAAAQNLGILFGPPVGGGLILVGLAFPYYAIFVLTLISILAIVLMLPKSNIKTKYDLGNKPSAIKPWDKRIRIMLMISVMVNYAVAVLWQTQGFYIVDLLGVSVEESASYLGVTFMLLAGGALLVRFALMPILNLSAHKMVRYGVLLTVAGFITLVLANSLWMIVVMAVFVGVGTGMTLPGLVSLVSLEVTSKEQGAAAGMIGATASVGHIISPLTALPLYQISPFYAYLFVLFIMLIGTLLVFRLRTSNDA